MKLLLVCAWAEWQPALGAISFSWSGIPPVLSVVHELG